MPSYDACTINSTNPFARYAHRMRVKRSVDIAESRVDVGKILDYGCGSGVFIAEMLSKKSNCAIGYEPYMEDRVCDDLPIFKSLQDVKKMGPYATVTLFETAEHLASNELEDFLSMCQQLLTSAGGILISVPIEVGPALILKELNRFFHLKRPEYHFFEFIKSSVFGIPARRADNIKVSHKGFDFRRFIDTLEASGWYVRVLSYGPLPLGTWYGNSQVYIWANLKRVSSPTL